MSLPWVRLDSNIASHEKIVELLSHKDGHKAFTLYICALGYSGAHSTDGRIPRAALGFIHGTEKLAHLLVTVGLWDTGDNGWTIHNWATRQELAVVTALKDAARRKASAKANCTRWHEKGCTCWAAVGND